MGLIMQRHHTTKNIAWFLSLTFLTMSLMAACDKEITVQTNSGAGQGGVGQNNPVTPPVDNPQFHDHDETHGPDDDAVLIDPGFLNGSWRVATAAEDQPLAYFDLFHDIDTRDFTKTF